VLRLLTFTQQHLKVRTKFRCEELMIIERDIDFEKPPFKYAEAIRLISNDTDHELLEAAPWSSNIYMNNAEHEFIRTRSSFKT